MIADDDKSGAVVIAGNDVETPQRRGPMWLQFPRRAILLIAACAVAVFTLRRWPVSIDLREQAPGPALPALIDARALELLPGTLLLLGTTVVLALVMALLLAAVAASVTGLERRWPRAGRLALFSWMPQPVLLTAYVLLLLLFAGPLNTTTLSSPVGNNASTLLLGAWVLALYPALLAAQDGTRVASGDKARRMGGRSLAAFLQVGQSVLLQTAGVLSARQHAPSPVEHFCGAVVASTLDICLAGLAGRSIKRAGTRYPATTGAAVSGTSLGHRCAWS